MSVVKPSQCLEFGAGLIQESASSGPCWLTSSPCSTAIAHVDTLDVDDAWGDMDTLEALKYDETQHEVTLVAFGLIRARVARLEVQVEITPSVAGYVRRRIGKRSRWSSDRPL